MIFSYATSFDERLRAHLVYYTDGKIKGVTRIDTRMNEANEAEAWRRVNLEVAANRAQYDSWFNEFLGD